MTHRIAPRPGQLLAALAAAATVALTACGGGTEPYTECQAPSAAAALPTGPLQPGQPRLVVYGTGAPWFTGPLQAAPAAVSAEAGQQLWVCP
jgi:hypothetical protein